MAYNVRLGNSTRRVAQRPTPQYTLDVNYEIPSKSTQYTNLKLDDITSQFNGTTTEFPLTVNGEAYYALDAAQLMISINGDILEPGVDYATSDDKIIFTTAPTSAVVFFGVAYATTADLTRTLNYVIDSGNVPLEPGTKGNMTIDVTGVIESWTIISEVEGNLKLDIHKCDYQSFPNFVSICGTEFPYLGELNVSKDRKNKDHTLTGWTKEVTAGDIFQFEVLYSLDVTRFLISLKLKL